MKRFGGVAMAALLLGCAADSTPTPPLGVTRQRAISDQVHSGGTQGFVFLPPMVPKPATLGTVDPALYPTIRVDRIDPVDAHVLATVVTFTRTTTTATGIKLHQETDTLPDDDGDMDDEGYFVARWKTASYDLPIGAVYRVRVLVDGHELGFADVDNVGTMKQFRNVDRNEYVPLLDDGTLRIKFRIEARAVDGDGDGVFDWNDDCPTVPNADQRDSVGDHVGDACRCAAVTCHAVDDCHVAGACAPTTGLCSNPPAADGTTCSSGTCSAGVCTSPSCGGFVFANVATYRTGSLPVDLGVADLNGDGRLDLVSGDYFGGVGVHLGRGDGTFGGNTEYPQTGGGVNDLSLGDVDGDGKIDALVTGYTSSTLSLFLGNGDGTLRAAVALPTRSNAIHSWLGDANGDGKLDLAIANVDASLDLQLGNGDGTFGAPTTYDLSAPFARGSSGTFVDLDGDGDNDLVLGMEGNAFDVMIGRGDGTFAPPVRYASCNQPVSVVVRDVNRDGKLDAAVSCRVSSQIGVALGNGDGTFGTSRYFTTGTGPNQLAVDDFDGDGKLDVVTADGDGATATVLAGVGDGTFAVGKTFAAGRGTAGVVTGDFDRDGRADFAVDDEHENDLRIYTNTCNGTLHCTSSFAPAVSYSTGTNPTAMSLADVNRDGRLDLVTGEYTSGAVGVRLGLGDGTFGAEAQFPAGNYINSLDLADVDRDGKLDALVANYAVGNAVTLLHGTGTGGFSSWMTIPTGSNTLYAIARDVSGDGRPDLIYSQADATGTLSVALQAADGSFGVPALYYPARPDHFERPVEFTVADLDRDGRVDLVIANQGTNVVVMRGTGGGAFGAPTYLPTANYPQHVLVRDFDGDGKLDIVAGDDVGGAVSLLLGNGDGTFLAHRDTLLPVETRAVYIDAADVDADGFLDVAVGGYDQTNGVGSAWILRNDQHGNLSVALAIGGGSQTGPVRLGDLNGDAKADLVTDEYPTNSVRVHLSTCH